MRLPLHQGATARDGASHKPQPCNTRADHHENGLPASLLHVSQAGGAHYAAEITHYTAGITHYAAGITHYAAGITRNEAAPLA